MNLAGGNSGSGLEQTEIRFLVERNADGIIVVDEDGVVLFANPAAEAIFDRPPRSLIGSPIGIPVVAGDTTEIAIHKPGGRQIEAEIRVVETVWNQRPARLASLRDISARRAMEERLRHSAKMEAIGRLTAGIAHDFNNLLTVVLGNLESARRQSALAEAALLRALENATRGAQRAAGLTERLLAFARRMPLAPKVLDVNTLVSGMSDLLQRTLGEEIRVRTVLAPDLWRTEVDPTELEAAILNLAVNARDAMPSGGELLIETANVVLDDDDATAAVDAKAGPHVLIAVTDSGTGMTPDVLRQVFEPFFTTKGGRGTGLGLSQVYGFVAQSGGHVRLASEPGVGTTVKLHLPKAMERSASASPQADEGRTATQLPRGNPRECILVVEDDEDVRSYTAGSLRELGYSVFEAGDAASALDIVGREPSIRLLFTDLGLPGGVDGRVLGERVHAMRPSLSVLFTTAYAAASLIHDGRLDAGVDLLTKPFTFEALATRIRELMDRGDRAAATTRILLVEDETLLRTYVAETLTDLGCHVEEAANFREGLAAFHKVSDGFAAAIIDIGLPDQPGDELARQIRSARPDLPLLLTTGYASQVVRERVAQDPHLRILQKPFEPDRIRSALEQLGLRLQAP